MNITLPPRCGQQPIPAISDTRQITVIGANGTGKTHFCDALLKSAGDKAFILNALKAINADTYHNKLPGSIESRFENMVVGTQLVEIKTSTEFEKLFAIMLQDEFMDLMAFKTRTLLNPEEKQSELPKTKLDTTIRTWQRIFPNNRVLREQGKLLFTNDQGAKPYSSMRLSDGEKTVLYYIGATLYAMPDAVILVDEPEVFLHHSITQTLWNVIESLRPDCTFIYNTHDVDFAASRTDNTCIWIRSFDVENQQWNYEIMQPGEGLSDELYFDLVGSRKPILFIEGDATHSIDSRLYPLIFTEYTVKPMGSCNKVIEATRSFNDLRDFHQLDSHGIVDRDRRDEKEVEYLRLKKIFVPDVAEVENLMLLPDVIRAAASYTRRDPERVLARVQGAVMRMFAQKLKSQALEHVRHRVKRNVEVRIDKKFTCITALEDHMVDLVNEINPRGMYEDLCRKFHQYSAANDYEAVLRVFNEKKMLVECDIASLLGLNNKDDYIRLVLNILKTRKPESERIRTAIKRAFGIEQQKND